MSRSVQIVNSALGALGLIGLGVAVGVLAAHLSVQNVKTEWETWALLGLGALVAVELVTVDGLARARAQIEQRSLYAHLSSLGNALDHEGRTNRQHTHRLVSSAFVGLANRLADTTGALTALDERTRPLISTERRQVAEVIEQLHAVSSILEDWRGRVMQNEDLTSNERAQGLANVDEPMGLLDLATDTLRALASDVDVTADASQPLHADGG